MIEIKKIQVALTNLDSQLDYLIQLSEQIFQQYKQLQTDYTNVCNERDTLQEKLKQLDNDKHNSNDLES